MASCACDVADGQGEDLASEDVTTSKKKVTIFLTIHFPRLDYIDTNS